MAQDEKRRFVGGDSFGFTPLPELAQDSQSGPAEQMTASEAPHGIQIRQTLLRGIGDEPRTGLPVPLETALYFQFMLQVVREWLNVMGIVACVALPSLG